MTLQAYLLAAGDGVRSGGPKAFKPYQGKTLLESQLAFLLSRFAPGKVAVSIQEAWRERCLVLHPEILWTSVPSQFTPLGSLQALLKASPLREWGFIYHVDMPLWETRLFDVMEAALTDAASSSCDALVPRREGRRGHPVLLSRNAAAELRALDASSGRLDVWLKTRRVTEVDVPFRAIHENWNR